MNGGHDDPLRVRGTGIFLNSTCAKSDIKKLPFLSQLIEFRYSGGF